MELTPTWEYVADTVMGGVSTGQLDLGPVEGRDAARLTGTVLLDNNGGFVQMAFDTGTVGADRYTGLEIDVLGNGEPYEVRLRTNDLTRPWQAYRAVFTAPPAWTTIRLPFDSFATHRTEAPLDLAQLRRIGVLAIGRAFEADIAIAQMRFYR
ncbi:CIA30 family protein [uncultured Tateyamaria sp.]|uniref:CIA30 family protein n=1 Tax=uncultured Tateyamaria sp. TaxID=455651 RepID=UPI00260D46D8|nr:CIA30 family protein [uncultured Tateyamaria sp.]